MSKSNRVPYERVLAGRALLVATWPHAFAGLKAPKKPLKIGVFSDIKRALPELSGRLLQAVLTDYTGGPSYLRGLVAGADRFDLEGSPAGAVLPEQELIAVERLLVVLRHRILGRRPFKAEATAGRSTEPPIDALPNRSERRAAARRKGVVLADQVLDESADHRLEGITYRVAAEAADPASLGHEPQAHTAATGAAENEEDHHTA